jgi:alkylation response protein AidB-like acyl-CoA dehydrogenase
MNREHVKRCARVLAAGSFGGFATTIGEAMLLADSHNFDRVAAAFPDLIQRAAEAIAYAEAAELINKAED